MSTLLRRRKLCPDVNEDEVEQQNNNNQPTDQVSPRENNQGEQILKDYQTVCTQLAELDRRYNNDKQPLLNRKSALMAQAAKAGIVLTGQNESSKVNYNFSKKIYESVQSGKTDALIGIVSNAFINLPDLSYSMDAKGITSFSKKLLSYLNEQQWNDGEDHWSDVAAYITTTITKANVSFSTRELSDFITELKIEFRKSSIFAWIFGKIQVVQNPDEVEEVDTYEEPVFNEPLDDISDDDMFASLHD